MIRPVLLLDIDGVLNPYGSADPPVDFTDHDVFPGEEPIRVNPAHGSWLMEAGNAVDIAWASGWNEDANQLLAPLLRIPPFPVVTMPPPPFDASEKVSRIASYVRQRPAAWIDDVHTAHAHRWAAERPAPTLLITADPTVGLTRDAIEQVIAWAMALLPVDETA